jgi:lipoate-protein ligase A
MEKGKRGMLIMEKETWKFVDSGYGSPSFNMALDEALLEWNSKGAYSPIVFILNPISLSIVFQRWRRK